MRHPLLLAGLLIAAGRLSAQVDSQQVQPVDSIVAADIARHVGVLTHDSMRGRVTPSPGLEKAARYVADQFQALGLEPVGDSGTWFQRYPAEGDLRLDYDRSMILFLVKLAHRGKPVVNEWGGSLERWVSLTWATDIGFAVDTVLDGRAPDARGGGQAAVVGFLPFQIVGPPELLIAGPHTVASLQEADLRDKVVLYVPPAGVDPATQRQIVDLLRSSNNNVVIITNEDSAAFAQRHAAALRNPPVVPALSSEASRKPIRWAVYVRQAAVEAALASAGVDVGEVRASDVPVTREVATFIMLGAFGRPLEGTATAPNTVGMLRSKENSEVVVILAHMDQTGLGGGRVDSLDHGADDNASGVAGILALAKAFRQAGPLRRSIVFAAVSGTKDSRGSTTLANELASKGRIGVSLNLHMIGRAAGDSVRVAGLRDANFPTPPAWIAAKHPELGITVVDGGTAATPQSDHFPFVQNAIPSLSFHNGSHDDDSAAPPAVDADQEARILRLVFYVAHDIVMANRLPALTTEGHRQLLEVMQSP